MTHWFEKDDDHYHYYDLVVDCATSRITVCTIVFIPINVKEQIESSEEKIFFNLNRLYLIIRIIIMENYE